MDSEFDHEIDEHLEQLTERFRARGMSLDDARLAARRQFGNSTALRETRREMGSFAWCGTLLRDLRQGARMLTRNKGFAAVAVGTLALGIGANTAIFSVVNAAILQPLPYPDPARLVVLWGNVKRVHIERRGASYPDYQDWRDQSRSFETMAAFDDAEFALTGTDTPERIAGEYVSPSYFSLLGIRAAMGRTFRPDEDRIPQRDAVAVLSDALWKRRFGGDAGSVGRSIELDNKLYTIVGIAPPGFRGLTDQADVWIPFQMEGSAAVLNIRGNRWFRALGRLKPGVSLAHAQAEMDTLSQGLAKAYPATNEARGVELSPLAQETFGDLRRPLLVLMTAVGLVLLIAATNVANLLLARSEARHHEVAMRTALGAGRGRLLRQFLAESAVLVASGCATGLVLAHYGIALLMAASPVRFPSFVHPSIDVGTCIFTLAVCATVTLALGLAPAAQLRSGALDDALKQGVLRSTGARGGSHFRDALVVAEISLSLLLLVGAGLMIHGLRRMLAVQPGFDASHVVTLRVNLPQAKSSGVAAADILRSVSALPSVQSVSLASDPPLSGLDNAIFYSAEGQQVMNAQSMPRAYVHRVSPDFFQALRVRLVAGRSFSDDDIHQNSNVAIVTENLAKRFWRGQDPIGKRIKEGRLDSDAPWRTIVGVVPELKYRGLPDNPTADPDVFGAFNEHSRNFSVLVRTSLESQSMVAAIRETLHRAEPSILIYNAGTLEESIGEQTARPRFTGWLMSLFAAMALILAMIGVYGVMSYTVSRRTREIGLRMALGAGRPEVLRLVVGRGMLLVTFGILLGAAAALGLAPVIGTLVYDVRRTDPQAFAAAAALLGAVAMTACLLPAFRATRIDPVTALRHE